MREPARPQKERTGEGPPGVQPIVGRGAVVRKWLVRIALVALLLGLLGGVGGLLAIRSFEEGLPSITDLRGNYHPAQVTRVLARDGTVLAELFTERRTVVAIATLPPHVKLAVLAAEDAGFYEHEGLNYFGIVRAFLVNLRAGRTRQGGSTITQQVVKNLLLDPERTYRRKIREALLARRLEQELKKDEILELYLNHIYFGHGRYGIEEAARDDFGKSAKDISIAEAALLAGEVAGPETYSPRKDPAKALTRRAFVLAQMHEKNFLSDAQYAAATEEPLRLAAEAETNSELAPEVVEIAKRTLRDRVHERAALGGYTIVTTIDPRLQAAARKAVRDDLDAYDKRHGELGARKGPPQPRTDKNGRAIKPATTSAPLFEGAPSFEAHKVLVGAVASVDDAAGTFDVQVGTALGTVKLAEYARYNPEKLAPSAFAPVGAHVRVSLLAPAATVAPADDAHPQAVMTPVPLRLELGPEGALVAIDTRSRQVLALIGSYEGASGALDRATQSRRQPGSTFKPIVYSYALHSRRFTPSTLVDVRPAVFEGGYRPANYEGWTAEDPLRLREALANSVNVVAVRVLADVGPANVVEWGHALGIRSVMKPDLSLALGSYEVLPLELCGAYATFAAGGTYEEPSFITSIVGPDGKEVPLDPPVPARRVLDPAEAYVTTSMLASVIDHGTGAAAKRLGRPLAGKTGTSNLSKDTWFAGYSTDLAAVVWVGFDDGKPLGGGGPPETGATAALPAWLGFMKDATEHKPASEFPRPPGVATVVIDTHTGMLPTPGDPDTMSEIFLEGTQPTTTEAPDAGGPPVAAESKHAGDAGGH